jgi:crossover junction endodeoxyribonuclease RuvC
VSIVIGIDPGKTGAIALVMGDGALVDVFDMPVVGGLVSARLLCDLEYWASVEYVTVVIEDVHAMPRNGSIGSFSLGRSKGIVEGVFAAFHKPIVYVSPAKWKREMRVTAEKGTSRRRAIDAWPAKSSLFARVKDDGRAEAALIALWHVLRTGGGS